MDRTGVIAWFVRNHVAANLLMLAITLAGAWALLYRTDFEVFPTVFRDQFVIETTMVGSSQQEMDGTVSRRIASAVQGIGEITKVHSFSSGSYSQVVAEVSKGEETALVLERIKAELDGIQGFPESASRPRITVQKQVAEVLGLAVWGELPSIELLRLTHRVRKDLLAMEGITSVELMPEREFQIIVEVPQLKLQEYALTMQDVAQAIERGSSNLVAGSLQMGGRELLLRTQGQAYSESDFNNIPVITGADGALVLLGDIATVYDDLDESTQGSRFNGSPSLMLQIYRVGGQSAIDISDKVHRYIEDAEEWLPRGANLTSWRDMSEMLIKRISTMLVSMVQGGILIVILLSLFLRPTVSLWVTMSIPVTFIGSIILLSLLGVSINVVTLFAFILVLGFVVDDAIVTGENIHTHLSRGKSGVDAAIDGTQEVSVPVTFGILTSVVAFVPLALDPSIRGQLFAQIPAVVIPVLLISWLMSKLVLPAKLKHMRPESEPYENRVLERARRASRSIQEKVTAGLVLFINKQYKPVLTFCLRFRYLTLSVVVALLMITVSLIGSGRIAFVYFPAVPAETAVVSLRMPPGSLVEETSKHLQKISDAALQLQQKYTDEETGESAIMNIYSSVGAVEDSGSSHVGKVMMEMLPPESRSVSIDEVLLEWNTLVGPLSGIRDLQFSAEAIKSEPPLSVHLSGDNQDSLRSAAQVLVNHLATYKGISGITNSADNVVNEFELTPLAQANSLSVGIADIAEQVRQSFHGYEVQQLQRGGEEVSVILRKPSSERQSISHLQNASIRTSTGDTVLLSDVANIRLASSPEFIEREDQKPTVRVSAEVDKNLLNISDVQKNLRELCDELIAKHPEMSYSFQGENREQQLSIDSIGFGLLGALFGIYTLLAIPFRSYGQPLVVMSVIPFGLIGAVIGHVIMGLPLSILSIMGIVALVGIGINDSLVLVDYINRQRRAGVDVVVAARQAGIARFRPVLLTSMTTFAGFFPLMLETTTQAQWLVPMAVSLGYGILFTSVITLIVIPCNYLIGRDIRIMQYNLIGRFTGKAFKMDIDI